MERQLLQVKYVELTGAISLFISQSPSIFYLPIIAIPALHVMICLTHGLIASYHMADA